MEEKGSAKSENAEKVIELNNNRAAVWEGCAIVQSREAGAGIRPADLFAMGSCAFLDTSKRECYHDVGNRP